MTRWYIMRNRRRATAWHIDIKDDSFSSPSVQHLEISVGGSVTLWVNWGGLLWCTFEWGIKKKKGRRRENTLFCCFQFLCCSVFQDLACFIWQVIVLYGPIGTNILLRYVTYLLLQSLRCRWFRKYSFIVHSTESTVVVAVAKGCGYWGLSEA